MPQDANGMWPFQDHPDQRPGELNRERHVVGANDMPLGAEAAQV
jgi:hypothetical protein